MVKNLERITWNKKSWRKQDGTKINPEKIGDSLIVRIRQGDQIIVPQMDDLFQEASEEKIQKILEDILNKHKSSEYLSKEKIAEINAYSSKKPENEPLSITYAINFYKI